MRKTKNIIGTKVSFFPASLEYKDIQNQLHKALDEVGKSGYLILGPKVKEFEQIFAKLTNRKFCVSCASGTDAITLSLKVLNIGVGDEVIVPANAYPTIFGVALSGATPVLADVEKETGHLDALALNSVITEKTKAIVGVHLYGLPLNVKEISRICKENKLFLIEDCAQAYGSEYKNQPVGSFGDLAMFSFYPTKNLGAMGDGGAVVTNKKILYEKLQMYRMYGEKGRYDSRFVGNNSRLDELQAAFLLAKLPYINRWLETRKIIANIYNEELEAMKDIQLPPSLLDRKHSYHLYVIRTSKRDALKQWLMDAGIETGVHYPKPIHYTKAFSLLGKNGSFQAAENWSQEALSLPMHPYITQKQIYYVTEKIKEFFNSRKTK